MPILAAQIIDRNNNEVLNEEVTEDYEEALAFIRRELKSMMEEGDYLRSRTDTARRETHTDYTIMHPDDSEGDLGGIIKPYRG